MSIEQLLAERAIEKQLYRLARAMDGRDWDALAAVFAEDAVADFGIGEISGRSEIVAFIRSFLDHCGTTQHVLGNILVDVQEDEALSESYVADLHLARDEASGDTFRTLGNYSDTWARNGEQWEIVRRLKDNRATVGTMDVFGPAQH